MSAMRKPQIVDEALRDLPLKIDDPEDQEGLVRVVPPGAELVRIINTYEIADYPRRKIWCAECRMHFHKRVFAALVSNGSLITTGSTCGKKLFGTSWSESEREFARLRERQVYLRWLERARLCLPDLIDAVKVWRLPIALLAKDVKTLRESLPHVAEELAASNDGILMIAERQRVPADRRRPGQPEFDWINIRVGHVSGTEVLKRKKPVHHELEALIRSLEHTNEHIRRPGMLSDSQLKSLRSRTNVQQFKKLFDTMEAGRRFFTPASFDQIARWIPRGPFHLSEASFSGRTLTASGCRSFEFSQHEALDIKPLTLARDLADGGN